MAKKLLCIITLILMLVCVLVSCSDNTASTSNPPTHTHSYGEWTIVKDATCTTDGSKERTCNCGEKETQTIYSSHDYTDYGICTACKDGWVTIVLPDTPLVVCWSDLNAFKITDMKYELGRYSKGYVFKLIYSGEKVIDNATPTQAKCCQFRIKLVDSDGYVVFSGQTWTDDLSLGDKVKNCSYSANYINLDPNKTYTLIVYDY